MHSAAIYQLKQFCSTVGPLLMTKTCRVKFAFKTIVRETDGFSVLYADVYLNRISVLRMEQSEK